MTRSQTTCTPCTATSRPLVIGILVSVYGGLGVTQAAINAMNQLWVVPIAERPGLGPAYGRGALYLLIVGVGLIITTTLSGLSTAVGTLVPDNAATETVTRIASTFLAIAVNTGLILVGFRLLTIRHITFRQHLPGAIVAAFAWQLLLLIGTYLVSHELQAQAPLFLPGPGRSAPPPRLHASRPDENPFSSSDRGNAFLVRSSPRNRWRRRGRDRRCAPVAAPGSVAQTCGISRLPRRSLVDSYPGVASRRLLLRCIHRESGAALLLPMPEDQQPR